MAMVLILGLIVVMPVPMLVFVAMPVGVGVLVVSQGNRHAVGLAGAGAFALAQVTAVGQAFDVVVPESSEARALVDNGRVRGEEIVQGRHREHVERAVIHCMCALHRTST
jgi:hypothetical protein